MNTKTNWIYIGLIAVLSGCSSGYYFTKADKAFDELRYSVAIEQYTKGLEKNWDIGASENLAHSYRLTNMLEKALPLYVDVSSRYEEIEFGPLEQGDFFMANTKKDESSRPYVANPDVYFHLGNLYMEKGDHDNAIISFSKYLKAMPNDIVAQMLLASCWSINERYRDTTLFELKTIPTEEFTGAFSAVDYRDGIVFTADKEVFLGGKKAGWTGNSYLDLYYMEKGDGGEWLSPVLLEGKLSGRFHEGSATFNEAGDEVYFTRSNYFRRKMQKNEKNENNLKIFKSSIVDGKWKNLEEFPFNSDDYSCGHPTLSKDGKTLYFISDMPGGNGGTDIYKAVFENGVWSELENLGDVINTPGNEMFPYIHNDGTLYFSSNAHNTMGGLDVFMTYNFYGRWMQPENLNYPLNTARDDFGFTMLDDNVTGFVSSTRKNKDELFEFTKNPPKFNLFGIARKKGMLDRVAGVTVTVTQESNGKEHQMISDKDGEFMLKLQPEETYYLVCTKLGCFSRTDEISTKRLKYSQDFHADFEVEEIEIGKPIVLENIYYDFDKWDIREDAAIELNNLVKLLEDNPTIHIEMGSHTDARGTEAYNNVLSDRRAMAAVDYLIYKGIESERLTWKGYGELVPLNKCVNKVKCSDDEHQLNRRTEFKVTKK